MKEESIREKTIVEYRKECFDPITKEFNQCFAKKFLTVRDDFLDMLKRKVKYLMSELTKIQLVESLTAGCIEISLLRTTFLFATPQISIDFFDRNQLYGNIILTSKMDINWFWTEWKEYDQKLKEIAKKTEWARFISNEVINTLMQETIDELIMILAGAYKYSFDDCHDWKELKELEKTEVFYISIGGYKDWQKLVFVERKSFDIFMEDKELSHRYGRFDNLVYYKKEFIMLDLKASNFQDCEFTGSKIIDSELSDSTFINCKFENVSFIDSQLMGTSWKNCSFKNCIFKDNSWAIQYDFSAKEIEDVYRKTRLENCKFISCQQQENMLDECIQIQVVNQENVEVEP